MNETLKRSISGAIYVILLLASILFSTNKNFDSFFILFGIFLIIAVFEFCGLVNINKTVPILFAGATYFLTYRIANATKGEVLLYSIRYNQNIEKIVLFLVLLVSIKCLLFLFNENQTTLNSYSKYVYLIGYIILPLSFTPAMRLNLDSIKSPMVPKILTIKAVIIQIKVLDSTILM